MSSVNHHPSEDLLLDYHRGALAPGLELVVRTHVAGCDHCRRELKLYEAIGGVMLEEIEGVALSDNALELALARIERPRAGWPEEPAVREPVRRPAFLEGFELPDSLKDIAVSARRWVAPGVWLAPVEVGPQPKGAKTYLMFVRAGMIMPEHTHRGRETTVVLHGHFRDHKGEYRPGDFACCDEADCHAPDIWEVDCLCLIAQEEAIVPKTWLGRLLQPIARI